MNHVAALGALLLVSPLASCMAVGEGLPDRLPEQTVQEYPSQGGGPVFLSVRDLALAEGGLWVLDGSPPFLTFLFSDGSGAIQMGTEGDGPGEFRFPVAVQNIDGSDPPAAMVWDLGSGRVSRYTRTGDFAGSTLLRAGGSLQARASIREVSYSNPFRIRRVGDTVVSNVFPHRIARTSDIPSGSIQLTAPTLEPGPRLLSFADHVAPSGSNGKEWMELPMWDLCGGTLVFWSPLLREILWMGLDGRRVGSVPLEGSPAPLLDEDVARYLRRMARMELGPAFSEKHLDLTRMARAARDRFAENRPAVVDLVCQSDTIVWLQGFDTSHDPLGRGDTWQRLSMNGTHEMVRFPHTFTPFLFFDSGGGLGVSETAEGYQVVASWEASPGAHPSTYQRSTVQR